MNQCTQGTSLEMLRGCNAYGLIVDESTDIAVTKNLILYARVVKNCTVATLFLKNTEILDWRAVSEN